MNIKLLSWLAKVHYPSYMKYEQHKAEELRAKTIKAIELCRDLKGQLMRCTRPGDRNVQIVDAMLSILEARIPFVDIHVMNLRTRLAMYEAMNVKYEGLSNLDDCIMQLDESFNTLMAELNKEAT